MQSIRKLQETVKTPNKRARSMGYSFLKIMKGHIFIITDEEVKNSIQKALRTLIEEYDIIIRRTKTPRLSFGNVSQGRPVDITICCDHEYLLSDVTRV